MGRPKRQHAGRKQRSYSDQDRLDAMHAIALYGTNRSAAKALGWPQETIAEWTRQPKWATELARIRSERTRDIIEKRESEMAAYLGLGERGRLLTERMVEQEERVAAGERIPKDSRIRPAAALGTLRECVAAYVALDRAAKTPADGAGADGGVVVHVHRGTGVSRVPLAAEK